MSFEYIYVKLVKDTHGLEREVIETKKRVNKARVTARDAAINDVGCDDILYGGGSGIYMGFKEIPKGERWWKKNPNQHDGYYVLHPLAKTEQWKRWGKIQERYELDIGSRYTTTSIVFKGYPEIQHIAEKPVGAGRFQIAETVFGYVDGAETVIIGKIPITSESKIKIPEDFKEITTGEFYGYLGN